jgi:hypothetical protein
VINPGVLDLKMWQGVTWHYELLWEDGNPAAPVDLTGYEAFLEVRRTAEDTEVLIELDNLVGGAGGITLGGAAGTIDLDFDADDTLLVDPGWFVYDLRLDDGSGTWTRLVEGKFAVIAAVTRP